ncbi:MAG TPA: hypothetical protein VF498_08185 [Anaerolineales bacterium]
MVPREHPPLDFRRLYDHFDAPIAAFDCGQKCAPHNPSGKPFCCDICQAVPAAYRPEWEYLRRSTDLWHVWRGDECAASPENPAGLLAETPDTMLLLACQGPERCQRPYRALSCRQFPFFPYITSDGIFIGLAYEWDYEATCWVIVHPEVVTDAYREEFVRTYDGLFESWPEIYESYAWQSEDMRLHHLARSRRIPLLHRNGRSYLLSPGSERLRRTRFPTSGA